MENKSLIKKTCNYNNKKEAFTPLVKAFRSGWDSLLCRWHSQARNPRIPSFANAHASAFTLAETLITLSILGIVAAVTVPVLVGKQVESQNRTKLKKAMATYEKVINHMLIEHDLQTEDSFKAWAKKDATENNYAEELSYFKISEMSATAGYTNCRFKTGDGIWWDICKENDSNIENPIIILDKNYIGESRANLETMARSFENEGGKRLYIYAFAGRRDATSGSVRVNDKAYEDVKKQGNYPTYMEKLYAFIEKRTMAETDPYAQYATACTNECDINGETMYSNNCNGCTFHEDGSDWIRDVIIDENGNVVKDTVIGYCNGDNGTYVCWEGVINADGEGDNIGYCQGEDQIYKCFEELYTADESYYVSKIFDEDGNEYIEMEFITNDDGSGHGIRDGELVWKKTVNSDGSWVETNVERDSQNRPTHKTTEYYDSNNILVKTTDTYIGYGYYSGPGDYSDVIESSYSSDNSGYEIRRDKDGNKKYETIWDTDGNTTRYDYQNNKKTYKTVYNDDWSSIVTAYDENENELDSHNCPRDYTCVKENGVWVENPPVCE